MSNFKRGSLSNAARTLLLLMSGALIASCGGGSSSSTETAGIGGTGIVAGRITGFGSVFVNGGQYNTDTSSFTVDGVTGASQDDLEVGMVVLLEVETENGLLTSRTRSVVYDDEVQGPVAAAPVDVPGSGGSRKTFDVFGQTIMIDQTSTVFRDTSGAGNFGFDTIAADDIVEISGFRTSANDIVASYVEKRDVLVAGVSEVELRGTISMLDVIPDTFEIDGVLIRYATASIEIGGGLANGVFVEAEGVILGDGSVQADEIEQESEGFDSNVDDVSLQGIISNWVDIGNFEIDGQRIDASGATLSPANAGSLLDNGVEVEVEGAIVGGVLIADELELRDGDSELRTTIRSIDLSNNRFQLEYPGTGSASLGTIWVNVDGQTLFEDEAGATPVPNLTFNQLNIGDFVKVKGLAIVNAATTEDEVDAEIVKRRDPDSVKLEGLVQAKDHLVSFTILGITYPVDPGATYEEGALNATDFFNAVQVDTSIIELEDDDPADGDADEVEFDD